MGSDGRVSDRSKIKNIRYPEAGSAPSEIKPNLCDATLLASKKKGRPINKGEVLGELSMTC